jgi:hypothetical protein
MESGSTPVNALNHKIARRLDEVAQVLSEQGANPYPVGSGTSMPARKRKTRDS